MSQRARLAVFQSSVLIAAAIAVIPLSLSPSATELRASDGARHAVVAAATRVLSCGLWRLDEGFTSTVRLKNELAVAPLDVTPVFYMADGTEYDAAPVHLGISGLATIDVGDALATAPSSMAGHLSQFGSAALRYSFALPDAVSAEMQILSIPDSLSYVFAFGSDSTDPPAEHDLEGLWWKHDRGVGGFLALTNTGNDEHAVSIQLTDSEGHWLARRSFQVGAHVAEMLDLESLISDLPPGEQRAGGIRVEYSGTMRGIIVSGGLENAREGYSAKMPFFMRDHMAEAKETTYAAVGLMVGTQASMMGFPAGSRFMPYLFLRNSKDEPLRVTPIVYYMQQGQPKSLDLRVAELRPREVRELPLNRVLESSGIAEFADNVTVTLSFTGRTGDLLVGVGTVDQTGNFVFEERPQGVGQSLAKEVPFWIVGDGWDTMFTAWNPQDAAADYLMELTFVGGNGHYRMPIHLGPKSSLGIDLAMLIEMQQPDPDGNVIPKAVRQGSATFGDPAGTWTRTTLVVTGGAFNAHTATCHLYCITCSGDQAVALSLTADLLIGSSVQAHATLTHHDGTTADVTNSVLWSSNNTPVATVTSGGLVHGASAGSATITAEWDTVSSGQFCESLPPQCPDITFMPDKPICVGACIASISPAQGPVTMTVFDVMITGSGFGTSPTVNAGTGITVDIVGTPSDTQITANFIIASNATPGNHVVSIQGSAEGPGDTANFFVQVPTSLQLVSGGSATPVASCTVVVNGQPRQGAGCQRNVMWQLMDQRTPPTPIQASGFEPSDSLQNAGGTNSCGFPASGGKTGTGSTDSSGQFPDTYSNCSTACVNGGSCQSTELQTWTVSGFTLSSDVKTVVYTCSTITINGK